MSPTAVVTGAYSYTGSAVARSLIARGFEVRTLTNRSSPVHDPGAEINAFPLQFEDSAALEKAIWGADVFVNTYWVRYPYVGVSFDQAVDNSEMLFRAAIAAGVRRIVHVSVSNPSPDSPLAYYKGKAQVDRAGRATEVEPGPEFDRLWELVVAAFRYYATYQRKTDRRIPIFVFEPDDQPR